MQATFLANFITPAGIMRQVQPFRQAVANAQIRVIVPFASLLEPASDSAF
jgi:hypothetical protein